MMLCRFTRCFGGPSEEVVVTNASTNISINITALKTEIIGLEVAISTEQVLVANSTEFYHFK